MPMLQEFFAGYLPGWLALFAATALPAGLIVGFIGISAFLYIWAERKVSARMQDRLGPTRIGPFGLLQSLADGIKLITKEDFAPDVADKLLFRAAPYLAFCAAFVGYLVLPFGLGLVAQPISIGVFFMLAVLSSEVFGVMLAGYSSGSKWAIFGGVREAAQVVSYEVPRSLCVLIPVCLMGTLNLSEMSQQQVGYFWNWQVFHDPFTLVACVVFFITATASCKRAPFDLAEAESELVAGFLTEYSGIRWSYFFMAEYASMFAVSAMAAYLFLGGWQSGFLPQEATELLGFWPGNALNASVLVFKGTMLVLLMMWIRWSLPRLRIDQVMTTCLKYFVPIACGLLVCVCIWELTMPKSVGLIVRYGLAGLVSVGGVALVMSVLIPRSDIPRGELVGVWSGVQTPGMRGRIEVGS